MSTSRKRTRKQAENRAVASLPSAAKTTGARLAIARHAIGAVRANPDLANHPELQQSVTDWESTSNTVADREAAIANVKAQLAALNAQLLGSLENEKRAASKTLVLVNSICAGSAEAVTAYGFTVRSRTLTAPSIDPPVNVRIKQQPTAGSILVRWNAAKSAAGYFVQVSTDAGQTWGTATFTPRSTADLRLTPGQGVQIRVQVERRSGAGLWSAPVSVTVH